MRSLRRAWLLPRWRPRLNWDKIKKVRDLSSEDLLANTPWCWSYRNPDFPTLEDIDLELRLARFELLITRRPLLLNSVLLRQNPHNVHEWHKRVKLYEGQPRQVGKIISIFKSIDICLNITTVCDLHLILLCPVDHQHIHRSGANDRSYESHRKTSLSLGVLRQILWGKWTAGWRTTLHVYLQLCRAFVG